ncbi:General transcription factor IIE subunit 1 [Frankliniella fusca]|uniref:General transcription factor IIE subunit 1 n=1 Tax=Frankliniella fusca TaxID=407009 RepID=A0AAE1IWD7_9NEOP|nr:General transcription factor IIE subunit 1 [Frankliniella fusca]
MSDERLVTEVPSSLKQLARLVVRGFYTIEDSLMVDMLVRNPCMKEDDICELLRFERKMLRARIATLRSDKFIQVRLRMETGPDGKAQKVNYYFINYKTFVNVVKYKLDMMRKRMETEERDATSRASFRCPGCLKTFTDLEADQLFDMETGEFRCTYCRQVVEEDQSAMPKKDSRLLLAKFNEQLEPLYILLREVEGIKLAPEILEPEPVDINTIRGIDSKKSSSQRPAGENWSGEATRSQGFAVEEATVDVTIGDEDPSATAAGVPRKERPVWMVESTVMSSSDPTKDRMDGGLPDIAAVAAAAERSSTSLNSAKTTAAGEDIMSVLLAHERPSEPLSNAVSISAASALGIKSESDIDIKVEKTEPETMDSDDDDMEPTVSVGGRVVPLSEVNDDLVAQMTQSERDAYIQLFQDHYSHVYD